MAFDDLKLDKLNEIATFFGEALPEKATIKSAAAHLVESGITFDMYKEAFPADFPVETVAPVDPLAVSEGEAVLKRQAVRPVQKSVVLLKMTRMNPTYEIMGYKFTKTHPYLPVAEDDASEILSNAEGFSIASPREVEEFYS